MRIRCRSPRVRTRVRIHVQVCKCKAPFSRILDSLGQSLLSIGLKHQPHTLHYIERSLETLSWLEYCLDRELPKLRERLGKARSAIEKLDFEVAEKEVKWVLTTITYEACE